MTDSARDLITVLNRLRLQVSRALDAAQVGGALPASWWQAMEESLTAATRYQAALDGWEANVFPRLITDPVLQMTPLPRYEGFVKQVFDDDGGSHIEPLEGGRVIGREELLGPGSHKPFSDDGVTYCGWDGHEGCGEVWPCSTVRAAPRLVAEWDGIDPPDYVSPVAVGRRYRLRHGGSVIKAWCFRTEGFQPGVAEFTAVAASAADVPESARWRMDLAGWTVEDVTDEGR